MTASETRMIGNERQKVILDFEGRSWAAEVVEFVHSLTRSENYQELNTLTRKRIQQDGNSYRHSTDILEVLFVREVLLDLHKQGNDLKVVGNTLVMTLPDSDSEKRSAIRRGHLIGRNAQLAEPSVRNFVAKMERQHLGPDARQWHSIMSIMRDGSELSERLRSVNRLESEKEKIQALSQALQPYLQFVEEDQRCDITGLKLQDIWRYFRLTWANEYKSIPGRSINILIRDAAAPNHPVIGIASLGSSVVQHRLRDNWIGWSEFIARDESNGTRPVESRLTAAGKLLKEDPDSVVGWLSSTLDRFIEEVFKEDLLLENVITKRDLSDPNEEVIKKLQSYSDACIDLHRGNPGVAESKSKAIHQSDDSHWRSQAKTYLFKSKRSKLLAKLLSIKIRFEHIVDFAELPVAQWESQRASKGRKTADQLLRIIKAEHVGVKMMDITVCGAIPPYNHILGGKLVCMLLCSPEVIRYYVSRYSDTPSVIASSMQGRRVIRHPDLVLLCTTSLYGKSPNQYSRVSIPVAEIGFETDGIIRYKDIGKSEGFGTYHFSKETISIAADLVQQLKGQRQVNYVFGEGVSPLLRKLREAFGVVGFDSKSLLLHGNKRVTYGVALAKNFRTVLLGIDSEPKYEIPDGNASTTERIAEYWIRRWLRKRIEHEHVLEEVRDHVLAYPLKHGALVPIERQSTEEDVYQQGLF